MKTPRAFFSAALGAWLSLVPAALAAPAFTFRKVADSAMTVPGGTSTFGSFQRAVIEGGKVYFLAGDLSSDLGIYVFANGTITALVREGDLITPSNPNSRRIQALSAFDVDGDSIAFIANVQTGGSPIDPRIYRRDGTTNTEVLAGTPLGLAISGANVAAIDTDGTNVRTLRVYGANPRQVAAPLSPPGGFGPLLGMQGTTVTYGYGDGSESAIVVASDAGGVPIVTRRTPLPDFAGGAVSVVGINGVAGGQVSFSASTVANDQFGFPKNDGFFLYDNGNVKKIVDKNTRLPGTTDKFEKFDGGSVSRGKVAFRGDNLHPTVTVRPPTKQGVYFHDGDKLRLVAAPNSQVDGKRVHDPLDQQSQGGFYPVDFLALENDVIAVALDFSDGSRGLYLATPAPNTDTFVVNSNSDLPDSNPGDGAATTGGQTPGGELEVTLRAAMMEANAQNNENTITFRLPGAGPFVIAPATPLPEMGNRVTIDGTTQPGYGGTPIVQIDGTNVGTTADGLVLGGGKSTLRGLVVRNFGGTGIVLKNRSADVVENCYVGTDVSGVNARPNGTGIRATANESVIGGLAESARNVISGNTGTGIELGEGRGIRVVGNFIGTDRDGTQECPNATGVHLASGVGHLVGGAAEGAGNVISGNSQLGILIRLEGGDTLGPAKIQGNRIGTSASGQSAVPNPTGILIDGAKGMLIGGRQPGMANVISGNPNVGLAINGALSLKNIIEGNLIGVRPDGLAALPNGAGISIQDSSMNVIGGAREGAGNVISGNLTHGIAIGGESATKNRIEGNLIGLDSAGVDAVPNDLGVLIGGAVKNTIGGEKKGTLNVISGNRVSGIALTGTTANGNIIQRNFIGFDRSGTLPRRNTSNGIQIVGATRTLIGGAPGPDGPVGNIIGGGSAVGINIANIGGAPDNSETTVQGNAIGTNAEGEALPCGIGIDIAQFTEALIGGTDARLGNTIAFNLSRGIRNNGGSGIVILRNSIHSTASGPGIETTSSTPAPVLTSFSILPSGKAQITGTLDGAAGTRYRLEFYKNDAADPAGFGEGQAFLGFREYTGAGADIEFRVAVPPAARNISATATARLESGFLDTSAFSNTLAAPATTAVPLARRTGDARTIRFVEADGDAVTVRGARGDVLSMDGRALTLIPSAGRDGLAISVQRGAEGDGRADLGWLVVQGDLPRLNAPRVNFLGLRVEGLLGRLVIGDLLPGARLSAGGTPADRTRITARQLGSGALVELGSTLDVLTADSARDAAISAPHVGRLHLRDGGEATILPEATGARP